MIYSLIVTESEYCMLKMRWSLLAVLVVAVYADDKKEKEKEIGTVIGIDLGTTYSW